MTEESEEKERDLIHLVVANFNRKLQKSQTPDLQEIFEKCKDRQRHNPQTYISSGVCDGVYFLGPKYFFPYSPKQIGPPKCSAVIHVNIHGQTDTIDAREGQAFKATHISYI